MSDIGGDGGVVSERFCSKDHGYFIDEDHNPSLISFTFKLGAHHLEPSTPILSIYHGVFIERFIFRLAFRGK